MKSKLDEIPTKQYLAYQNEIKRKQAIKESADNLYNDFYTNIKSEGIDFGATEKVYVGSLTEYWKEDRIEVAELLKKMLLEDGWLEPRCEIQDSSSTGARYLYVSVTRASDEVSGWGDF